MRIEDLDNKDLVMLNMFFINGLKDNKTSLLDKNKYKKRILFIKRLLEDRQSKEQISSLGNDRLIEIRDYLIMRSDSNDSRLNNTLDYINELINERNEACRK